MIHVHTFTTFGDQFIPCFTVMTSKAGELFIFAAMLQGNIAMGGFSSIGNGDRLVVVALAALKALHLLLAGLGPKAPPLVPVADLHRMFGKVRHSRVDALV